MFRKMVMRWNRNISGGTSGRSHLRCVTTFFLALAPFAGCGGNPFSQVQVSGKVLYEDGTVIPAASLKLWFESQATAKDGGRAHPRPASAPVNPSDGSFSSATTLKYGDGLVRGKHKVSLDLVPLENGPARPIPDEYRQAATTPLVVDTAKLPLEIRIPKPTPQ